MQFVRLEPEYREARGEHGRMYVIGKWVQILTTRLACYRYRVAFVSTLRGRGQHRGSTWAWLSLLILFTACGKQAGAGADGGPSLDTTTSADTAAPPTDGVDGTKPDAAMVDGATDASGRPDAMLSDTAAETSRDAARSTPKLTWTLMTPGWDAEFISGAANGEIWITTRPGSVLQIRADGTSAQTSLMLLGSAYPTGLWVAGPDNVYISAYANLVLHWDGSGTWKRDIMPSGIVFESVWGSSPTDVYAAAGGAVYHSIGDDRWTMQPLRDLPLGPLARLTGTGANDLWLAAVEGEVYRSVGDGMWPQETKTGIAYVNDLWAASPNEAYFVTYNAIVHRLPSGRWATETAPIAGNEMILSVWGSGPTDVYAGTNQAHLVHSVGDGVWQDEGFDPGPGFPPAIKGIWGRSASDVYLATSNGIYHGVP